MALSARHLGADGRYHEQGGYGSGKEAARGAGQRELEAARGEYAGQSEGAAQ